MSAEATTREIKAVDSENQKNLQSDVWRMNQLQKHLSAKDHPYHKFSTGNWETLEVRPNQRGVDTREELLKFYRENYSANLMHLVVYSKDELDICESLVQSKFHEIKNTDRDRLIFTGQPCNSESLQIIVKAVPIKKDHKLRFVWPITPSIRHYKEGPARYLGHLIGHEGEGSLFYILKKLGWATSLSAGESEWTYEYSFFKVSIDLTDDGHEHFQDIVALLFKYIHLLQEAGPCQWIFDELAAVCETSFHCQDKARPIDYVVGIASDMKIYPPNDWLVGSALPSKFNPETILSALNELSPYNLRIFWESSKFDGQTNLIEPWYGTAYSVEQLAGSTIEQWVGKAPNVDLHLPAPNEFIPSDLSLKTAQEQIKLPVLMKKSMFSRLWYKPDTAFLVPKAYVKICFDCPFSGNSPESEVLTEIFTRMLMDYLNEYAYYAEVAGLHYGVHSTGYGFEVTVIGFNHKLRKLLETVIQRIAEFEVKPERFAVIKERVSKEYQNLKFQQPCQHAMNYCSLILQDQFWPWTDKHDALSHLEAEHLVKFYPLMLSKTFLECYVAGNIKPEEAESMIKYVEGVFFEGSNPLSQALFASQHMTDRIIKLEKGINYFYSAEGQNPSDENSALMHYIQIHRDDFKLNVQLQLFVLIAKQPTFHQLRTVEQLGYITVLLQRNDSGIRGLQFIIQSTVKGPGQIDLRVESFLKMFETKLYEMSNEEFKNNVKTLVEMKREKHKNLGEESRFYLREIIDGTLKFDRKDREVEALEQLSQKELIDFFNEYIKIGAPNKKSLSIRIYGNRHSSELEADNNKTSDPTSVRIEDIFTFKRSRPLYGSFKGGFGQFKL
ncbi:insulin-degrading enzyme-like 1, peroxisomal isoform X2 [Andrographis paniculata]|nr:insulin-degrading enzyme-like 1, peroxisomal isoform X2 [Andrographis paniculata]